MSRRATIVDAGVGNLGNLERALVTLGTSTEITREPEQVAAARCLLLPGVGAFRPPRETLRGGLEEGLREALARGAWLLGICVGFQLLFNEGEEFGPCDGLGLLQGRVASLPDDVPLPHIGWNRLEGLRSGHRFLRSVSEGSYAYFVHSFAPDQVSEDDRLASCRHGRLFPAIAGRGRILGTQFHPEKSGAIGLRMLDNFLEMAHGTVASD